MRPFPARLVVARSDPRIVGALALVAALFACTPPDEGRDAGAVDGGAQDAGARVVDAGIDDDVEACPAPAGAVDVGAIGDFDAATTANERRVVLMGGGVEVDRASLDFVAAAQGGDVLVLRATGSVDSYTSYFAEELDADPPAGSATTLLLDPASEGGDEGVLCRARGAEAIWLAGGDQSDYLIAWPDALHDALADTGAALGGTSAGAMALSELTFDAREGGVTSTEALASPAAPFVSVSVSPFGADELAGVLVDTHFADRDREGRLLAFLARAIADGLHDDPIGAGLDEGAALVIEGDAFRVVADDGAAASFYRVTGAVDVRLGAALGITRSDRVVLTDGATGAWPLDFAAHAATELVVDDGVVAPAP